MIKPSIQTINIADKLQIYPLIFLSFAGIKASCVNLCIILMRMYVCQNVNGCKQAHILLLDFSNLTFARFFFGHLGIPHIKNVPVIIVYLAAHVEHADIEHRHLLHQALCNNVHCTLNSLLWNIYHSWLTSPWNCRHFSCLLCMRHINIIV